MFRLCFNANLLNKSCLFIDVIVVKKNDSLYCNYHFKMLTMKKLTKKQLLTKSEILRFNRTKTEKQPLGFIPGFVDYCERLYQTSTPTPKFDKITTYLGQSKLDLSTQMDLDNLKLCEIDKYYIDRKLSLCSKMILPGCLYITYTGFNEMNFMIITVFVCYYFFQIVNHLDYTDHISKLVNKLTEPLKSKNN